MHGRKESDIILEAPLSELDVYVDNTNAVYRQHPGDTVKQEMQAAEMAKDDRSVLRDLRRQLFGDQS